MKKINPPRGSIGILIKEFSVTRPTIYASLAYYNNSDVAIAIRKRAIEMLESELIAAKETSTETK